MRIKQICSIKLLDQLTLTYLENPLSAHFAKLLGLLVHRLLRILPSIEFSERPRSVQMLAVNLLARSDASLKLSQDGNIFVEV